MTGWSIIWLFPLLLFAQGSSFEEIAVFHLSKGENVFEESLSHHLSEEYRGQELSLESLQKIRQAVLAHYQAQDHSFVVVKFPEQDVTEGNLSVQVEDAVVDQVSYSGNRWFRTDFLKKFFSVKEKEPLDEKALLNDVAWFNRNPFRSAKAVLSPGEMEDSSSVDLNIKDRFPLSLRIESSNTGSSATHPLRLTTTASWGNCLWRGDLLTYKLTNAPVLKKFTAHQLSYTSYPWKQELSASVGYSETRSSVRPTRTHSKSFEVSFRHKIPLGLLYKPLVQEIRWGVHYKNLGSLSRFDARASETPQTLPSPPVQKSAPKNVTVKEGRIIMDSPPTEGAVESPKDSPPQPAPIVAPLQEETNRIALHHLQLFHLLAGYSFKHTLGNHEIGWGGDATLSPPRWLTEEEKMRYEHLRASPSYLFFSFSVSDLWQVTEKTVFSSVFTGQFSLAPLPPSEKFGLGGQKTIRAYKEGVFSSDNGVRLNTELRRSLFSIFKADKLESLLFFDIGLGWNEQKNPPLPQKQILASVGPGLRYRFGTYCSMGLDYGFQLNAVKGDKHFGRLHFSFSAGY